MLVDARRIRFILLVAACLAAGPLYAQSCPCDCNGDERVAVSELVRAVTIATGSAQLSVCPVADGDGGGTVQIFELIRCVSAALEGCDALLGGPPPGVRRFSLDPSRSLLVTTFAGGGEAPLAGFTGTLDLRASGSFGGIHFIDVVGSSEYLAIDIPTNASALCIRPHAEAFPVLGAGVLYCVDGQQVGVEVRQDRQLGIVGTCRDDGTACAADVDCTGGECFSTADCTALEGTVDTESGVAACIGPLLGELLPEPSDAGALLIAPDNENGQIAGLPVDILTETALPCGDEPEAVGLTTVISLTTGESRAVLENAQNEVGETLETTHSGATFDCPHWTGENGPGTLVFSAPAVNTPIGLNPTDIITTWIFVD